MNLRPEGKFAEKDAPEPDQLLNCMRCGMCLPACPTYQLTGRERSSPRGRIALMRDVSEGRLDLTARVLQEEMDFCLGCLACTTACPAGVDYGSLLEATRDQLARRPRPWYRRAFKRLALGVFEAPVRLQIMGRLLWLYQKSGLAWVARRSGILKALKLDEAEGMLPEVPARPSRSRIPLVVKSSGPRVGMLLGCVMDQLFAEENVATVEVLQRNGCTVLTPQAQGCCGALHAHAGDLEGARRLARRNVEAYDRLGVDYVAVNSAGCGAMMKHYGHLLAEDPAWAEPAQRLAERVRDVHELLEEIGWEKPPSSARKVTYHDACHLAHGQGVTAAPRAIMRSLGEYLELPRADRCCGSAGTYNLTHPETAGELLNGKIQDILSTGAELVGVANPGCLLQIRMGLKGRQVRAEHPMVLLARAYRSEL